VQKPTKTVLGIIKSGKSRPHFLASLLALFGGSSHQKETLGKTFSVLCKEKKVYVSNVDDMSSDSRMSLMKFRFFS
jgi:hypothetical protein